MSCLTQVLETYYVLITELTLFIHYSLIIERLAHPVYPLRVVNHRASCSPCFSAPPLLLSLFLLWLCLCVGVMYTPEEARSIGSVGSVGDGKLSNTGAGNLTRVRSIHSQPSSTSLQPSYPGFNLEGLLHET